MKKGLHFIVLITFLVGVLAPACGFSWGPNGGAQYSVVEICTTQGIESRVVKNEQDPDTQHTSEPCQFCFAHQNIKHLMPAQQVIEAQIAVLEKTQFHHYEVIYLSRLTRDHTARAPPAFI